MKKIGEIFQRLFGVPWLVFGVQHFLYADFVAGLVPAIFPARIFWVYLTGAAMIAAGLAFIFNRKALLAAALLGMMLSMFVLLIHIPKFAGGDLSAISWTRRLQDLAIAAAAFILAGILSQREAKNNLLKNISKVSRYLFAILLIVFGVQQFLNPDFLTAKVPVYLPFRMFWVYLTGTAMVLTGASVLINKKGRLTAISLGAFLLLINLLHHGYLVANGWHTPLFWTAAMLDLAITCGVFILAGDLCEEEVSL
jgi:uncharacterized membrane protein